MTIIIYYDRNAIAALVLTAVAIRGYAQMRYEKGHRETTRQHIIDVASAQFRAGGVAAIGLAGIMPHWLLWAFVGIAGLGFAVMLPVSAAFVGTSMQTFQRLMIFQNWI